MAKGTLLSVVSLLIVAAGYTAVAQEYKFRFSTIYGDHMVLQQAPHVAVVWGYIPNCQKVTVMFNGKTMDATIMQFKGDMTVCKWKVSLPATAAGSTPYTVTAMDPSNNQISIKDVLFGDVWVCSGQSNMQFTVPQVYNASAEIAAAANYPMIRLFTAALESSSTPIDELISIEQNWSVAAPESVGGKAWGYFSATCWFFGRDLYEKVKYPIGLVDTDWGGTPVEAWSSPDALAKCKNTTIPASNKNDQIFRKKSLTTGPPPHTPSVLWNAMIVPFLNMTIKGAIWYQGEANAGAPQSYHCTFPAMIDDWREKWYMSTGGLTDKMFGFGFVQLAADGTTNVTSTGFPDIRWAQTANYGYVPNARLQNVFMAVAMDLGDPTSPFGSVHPRDKQDVGDRLSRAGMAVVYGDKNVYYQGPIATSASVMSQDSGLTKVSVKYKSDYPLELHYPYGFELGCVNTMGNDTWIEGTATSVDTMTSFAEFPSCPTGYTPKMVRYCWRTDPCTFKKCPIYAKDLPAPPYMLKFQ